MGDASEDLSGAVEFSTARPSFPPSGHVGIADGCVVFLLGGCAIRPVNPPIAQADASTGYRFDVRQVQVKNKDSLVILAFSGGGTRAAAFSYGVLEFLRRTEVTLPNGDRGRLLDAVDVITGVSGGSFTALAYGLHGDKLFDEYERRFLKRNVQGEIIARALSPAYWRKLTSTGWGRSELAAQLYDEILFNGATFGDLDRGAGPLILASATDISTGSRFVFNQRTFDVICSDLNAVALSRDAAASSAVPVGSRRSRSMGSSPDRVRVGSAYAVVRWSILADERNQRSR